MNLLPGIVLFSLVVLLLTVPNTAEADIYLSKSNTGGFLLTNSPERYQDTETYKLITRSETPTEHEIPKPEVLNSMVQEASEKYSVPEPLIFAVIDVESDGDSRAQSQKGALGLMQLMPETAEELGVSNPLDPRQNIFGGTKYLKRMLARFNGDLDQALAGYNAGPSTVARHGGLPPYAETKQFVERVNRRFEQFKTSDDIIYTYRDEQGVLHVTNLH